MGSITTHFTDWFVAYQTILQKRGSLQCSLRKFYPQYPLKRLRNGLFSFVAAQTARLLSVIPSNAINVFATARNVDHHLCSFDSRPASMEIHQQFTPVIRPFGIYEPFIVHAFRPETCDERVDISGRKRNIPGDSVGLVRTKRFSFPVRRLNACSRMASIHSTKATEASIKHSLPGSIACRVSLEMR